MGFRIRDIIGGPAADALVRPNNCPSGKTGYRTKADADAQLRRVNPTQRTNMRRYRCDYCAEYHLGHRRGAIY